MTTPETTPVEVTQAELKPCPFCGGEAKIIAPLGFGNIRAAECCNDQCSATGPWARNEAEAIAAWNTRPPLANRPTERALVEAARAVERHLLTEMPGMWGNAPGHGHKVVGIWDRDPGNGDKGGTACEWCAQWDAFRAALKAHGETVA